jgi:Bacterial tandem repeat domain 1
MTQCGWHHVYAFQQYGGTTVEHGLFSRQSSPQYAYYFGVDPAQHQRNFNEYASQGYRMISLSAYGVPPSVIYAAVWVKRDGPQWLAIHDASASTYQNWVVSNKNAGYVSTIVTVT